MEKMFRGVEQTFKKQRILKPLHEFLEEQQEPFLLEDYLLDRQYSSKRIYSCSNSDLSRECCEGLPKLVVQSKKPHLLNFNCLQDNEAGNRPRSWSSSRCLLEMNHSQKKKRRRAFRGKSRTNLDTLGYSEEYHMEEHTFSVKRLKFTLLKGNPNEMMEEELSADLVMKDVGSSYSESEGGLIQCTKLFSFKKEKGKKSKESEAKKIVKCSLLKSILRRLTLTKHLLPNIHTDLVNVSKKLSIAKTKLGCKTGKDELYSDDQSQLRTCDIVSSWNSFKEAQHTGKSHGASVDKGCILSKSATFPDLKEADSVSAKEAGDLLQMSNINSQEIDMECRKMKMELQSVRAGSDSQSWASSATSSSSFGTCFDSEMGSISGEKLSSNKSFEESRRDEFLYPQGIVACGLETTGSSVSISLDSDEYQVKNHQSGVRNVLDQSSWATTACDDTAGSCEKLDSSNDALNRDYMLSPGATLKSFNVFQKPRDNGSPVIMSECMVDDDSRSVETNCSSEDDEDEENVYSPDGLRQRNRDVHCHEENVEYAPEIERCVESKELSPVSILEILFEEETSSFDPCSARTHITEHHLVQRLTNYGKHTNNDPLTLGHESLGKGPSQSVYRNLNFSLWNQDNIDGVQIPNSSKISSQFTRFQCEGEIDWEQSGADEHIKEVLNSQEMLSCLTDSNKTEFQDISCFQPSKRKGMPMKAGNLLFDCVKEVLESSRRKQFGNGVLRGSWLKQFYVPEQLAKAICDQIYSWTETDTSVVENLVELAWKKEAEDWTNFWEETDEIGTEIEGDILGLLIEELVADLACLQT